MAWLRFLGGLPLSCTRAENLLDNFRLDFIYVPRRRTLCIKITLPASPPLHALGQTLSFSSAALGRWANGPTVAELRRNRSAQGPSGFAHRNSEMNEKCFIVCALFRRFSWFLSLRINEKNGPVGIQAMFRSAEQNVKICWRNNGRIRSAFQVRDLDSACVLIRIVVECSILKCGQVIAMLAKS